MTVSTEAVETVTFGVPSFNEGSAVVTTLESIHRSALACGLAGSELILSDSSETTETVDRARAWSVGKGLRLVVDRSESRRSAKEARNVLFDRARSDSLVQVDADVVIEPKGLGELLRSLSAEPRPDVSFGMYLPDPKLRELRYRASAWQMKAVARLATWLPLDHPRGELAFWACRRSFCESFRFPLHTGRPDSVEIVHYLSQHVVATHNCLEAVAYKVPAGTLEDFYLQSYRCLGSPGVISRSMLDVAAALVEAAMDPLGACLYAYARLWSAWRARQAPLLDIEYWPISESTKIRPD